MAIEAIHQFVACCCILRHAGASWSDRVETLIIECAAVLRAASLLQRVNDARQRSIMAYCRAVARSDVGIFYSHASSSPQRAVAICHGLSKALNAKGKVCNGWILAWVMLGFF
jgi:hypothetical protein